ncbi:MAG: hypothetical protein ACE5KT_11685 [Methanosarcinales archaeon]
MEKNEILHNLGKKANSIYQKHKSNLEREHYGKIIAIDLDMEEIIEIGSDLQTITEKVSKKRSGHKIEIRKVGKNPSVGRIY